MFSSSTDAAGHYSLPAVACTYFYVRCSKETYDPEVVEMMTVPEDETITVDFSYHFTDTGNALVVPAVSCLTGNYPNPFNPETTITYNLAKDGPVELTVFNSKGQKVCTLVDANITAGKHSVVWHGQDASGKTVASGIYFYRMKTDTTQDIHKMILMK
jgi:hypothetical protein